jgi:hypothetical protein
MLIVLFAVVFALMFVLERLQATGKSVQAHPPATAAVVRWEFSCIFASCGLTPNAVIKVNFTDKREIYED